MSESSVVVRAARDPLVLVACGFGLGLLPKAPGTFGTLLGVPIYLSMASLPTAGYVLVVGLLFLLGIPLCTLASRKLGRTDPPQVVWDEVVGYLATMLAAPPGWIWMLVGFLAFRFFDILKPWPVAWIDRRVHGGLGIMVDDLAAGVYAWAVVQLLSRFFQVG